MNIKTVFLILSLSLIFNIDGRLSDCYLRSLGLTKEQFFFRILELVLEVIALIIGARWELIGISIAVVFVNILMIVIKTQFIAKWVGVSFVQTLGIVLNSWRFSIFIVPLLICSYLLLPHTFLGNIILAVIFTLLCVVAFLIFPKIVGGRYANEAHQKVLYFLMNKIRFFNHSK